MSKAKAENKALPKRFYQLAETRDGRIYLDGKELKTQGRNALVVPAPQLAEAIAAEWNAQAEFINPDRMPLTRLCNLALDRATAERAAYEANILAYLETDLLCYRTPQHAQLQASLFDPVLQWAAGQGIILATTDALMPIAQPHASLEAASRLLARANDAEITGLALMVPLLGSAVLALAVWQREISVESALTMARFDEDKQAEQWGVDAEAFALWQHKQNDILAAAFFLTCNRLDSSDK